MAVLSEILLISPSSTLTSTKYIDAICQHVENGTFCMQMLRTYPPAVSATDLFSLANIVINLGISYANNTGGYAAETAKREPTLKAQFNSCQHEYDGIQLYLRMARGELKESPMSANYDIFRCTDITMYVKDLVGGNRDNASKTFMEMTLQMENLIDVAIGATVALGG
ncbi:Pectinesterase inhibitor domain [Arabidopsis thaliana x Arabidopsis arenosa]|uniref:Pectinesterase inhibitor domain n=1 Tax=Arabidopsis thaliana x Arabidopsis arenosa TaxID=1240361 RepID=A0A8T1XGN6_9BRAS|nr:Pectinesterase inhibitor domain [Arabidopsis thaliana x Arabidopsis arenosa]